MSTNNESAVSPVVGVMLMLVVTIIIAALVSAYAGGLSSSQVKPPQASISAEYSQAEGMVIYHNGGDTLTTVEFQILLTPSKNLGATADINTEVVNKSILTDPDGDPWVRPNKGTVDVPRFAPGDVAYISAENCGEPLTPHLSYGGLTRSSWVGGSFFLDFVTNDGKKITRVEVPIRP